MLTSSSVCSLYVHIAANAIGSFATERGDDDAMLSTRPVATMSDTRTQFTFAAANAIYLCGEAR
jgi:hypothetical protein